MASKIIGVWSEKLQDLCKSEEKNSWKRLSLKSRKVIGFALLRYDVGLENACHFSSNQK